MQAVDPFPVGQCVVDFHDPPPCIKRPYFNTMVHFTFLIPISEFARAFCARVSTFLRKMLGKNKRQNAEKASDHTFDAVIFYRIQE